MRLLLKAPPGAVRAAIVSCGLVGTCLGTRPARAAEAPFVLLELEHCEELSEKEVRRVFAAELGTRATDAPGKDVTQVTVSCEGAQVRVIVKDPLTQKTVQRSFEMDREGARARSRLVAIAAMELVVASWTELEINPRPKVAAAGPSPDTSTALAARQLAREKVVPYEPTVRHWYDADRPPARRLRLMATGSMRAFFDHDGYLAGGGLRVGEEPFHYLGWAADALIEQGTLKLPGQHYDVTTVTTGAWLMLSKTVGFATLRAGAGLRAGLVASDPLLPGVSSEVAPRSSSTVAPWGWPLGVTSVTLAIGRYVVADLAGECGYAVIPVQGGGATVTGAWFSGQIGVGFVLPSSESAGTGEEEVE